MANLVTKIGTCELIGNGLTVVNAEYLAHYAPDKIWNRYMNLRKKQGAEPGEKSVAVLFDGEV